MQHRKGDSMSMGGLAVSGILVVLMVLIIAALVVLVIILLVNQAKLRRRLDSFMAGTDGGSLESELQNRFRRLQVLEEKDAVEDQAIRDLYDRLSAAYQKTGVVKYDAFSGGGGKLSFAVCFLDGADSGIIMNVMNSSEGSYCYLKEVEKGKCSIALGSEEAEALDKAMYS